MSHLTAVYKLHVNAHDRSLLATALSRWSMAMNEALDRARSRQGRLLDCLTLWESKDGRAKRLVVSASALHREVLDLVPAIRVLHSSARMSMIVAVEELLASWLGQYCLWLNEGRERPKPAFPHLPPGSPELADRAWAAVLVPEVIDPITTPGDFARWQAEVTRAAKERLLPLYFGAATSGLKTGEAHCGLLRRADGRLFALLTLWPQGDPLGEPTQRAKNRLGAGDLWNLRAAPAWARPNKGRKPAEGHEREPPSPYDPTPRARASILAPLEFASGHRILFEKRAVPTSAELCRKPDGFYLHVAFDFPDHPPRDLAGNVLGIRRGVATLAAAVVLAPDGAVIGRERFEGRDLARLVTALRKLRALKQAKGRILKGDRRQARVVEHHLYSAAHQIVDLACRHGAQIVLLEDPSARRPQRMLAYKHFHRLAEILVQLAAEAGLPEPKERPVYGSWKTCVVCGWEPGRPVKVEDAAEDQCPGCGAVRDPDCHLAHLLALDSLRLRLPEGERGKLGEWIRERGL
jgi:hypothetical protein